MGTGRGGAGEGWLGVNVEMGIGEEGLGVKVEMETRGGRSWE